MALRVALVLIIPDMVAALIVLILFKFSESNFEPLSCISCVLKSRFSALDANRYANIISY